MRRSVAAFGSCTKSGVRGLSRTFGPPRVFDSNVRRHVNDGSAVCARCPLKTRTGHPRRPRLPASPMKPGHKATSTGHSLRSRSPPGDGLGRRRSARPLPLLRGSWRWRARAVAAEGRYHPTQIRSRSEIMRTQQPQTMSPRARATGAQATGASSTGAASVGFVAVIAAAAGAAAMGALAIGALAVGRLRIGDAAVRRLRIAELEVDQLRVRQLQVLERTDGG